MRCSKTLSCGWPRCWLVVCASAFSCCDADSAKEAAPDAAVGVSDAQAQSRDVTIRFKAKLKDRDFACGERYPDMGSSAVLATPADFRFYVQDLRLLNERDEQVPVQLSVRDPWQTDTVALLDFEDATGGCSQGTAVTNAEITGRVPAGNYHGVVFKNGVPEALNHEDPLLHPAPLQISDLNWSWLSGFKFFVAQLRQVDSALAVNATPGLGLLHVGSRACTGDPMVSAVCERPNRNEIVLDQFDPDANVIVADLGALFADSDLTQENQCHSDATPACAPLFLRLGIDWDSGQDVPDAQHVYRVE
jgi:uncharacterized repeat protein (TIGR04052 family)